MCNCQFYSNIAYFKGWFLFPVLRMFCCYSFPCWCWILRTVKLVRYFYSQIFFENLSTNFLRNSLLITMVSFEMNGAYDFSNSVYLSCRILLTGYYPFFLMSKVNCSILIIIFLLGMLWLFNWSPYWLCLGFYFSKMTVTYVGKLLYIIDGFISLFIPTGAVVNS